MTLSAEAAIHNDVAVLTLSGTLQPACHDDRHLSDIVAATIENGSTKLVLNVRNLTRFDGLFEALKDTMAIAGLYGVRLVVAEVPERVAMQFDKMRLGPFSVAMFPTEQEAIAAYAIEGVNLLEAGKASRAHAALDSRQIGPLPTTAGKPGEPT